MAGLASVFRSGAAEGGCGGNSAAPERFAERSEAGQCRFRFLDLCIRFGKIISKVCEGFNSGAKLYVVSLLPRRFAPRQADCIVFAKIFWVQSPPFAKAKRGSLRQRRR